MNKIKFLVTKYQEVISYLIFGVLTTIVNIAVFYVFNTLFDINYLISNGISWFFSVLFAFYTNKYFVFKSNHLNLKDLIKEIGLFFWFRLLSGGIDMVLMFIMVSTMLLNQNYAKIITQVVIVILNYVFSKLYIFKKE